MALLWHLFLAFFIPSIVGYGGGPASIPLIQNEVVDKYGWYTTERFGELLAMGNALPGPIATKMAGYIGYEQGGVLGAAVALFATVAPSLFIMIALLQLLYRHRHAPGVKRMTAWVRPTVAVLLGVLALQFVISSWQGAGVLHTLVLAGASYYLLEHRSVNPAYVIAGSLLYGAVFIA
ncbi:chromate transporter [Paenibacillus koleovorans]|uniref:chromate transporter n=1 Tax=Paenibacillus koleovorans TaxID=121608 RepID=UPI000FD8E3E6|nr:chromate transporter [Paenibacillus koleovorans]